MTYLMSASTTSAWVGLGQLTVFVVTGFLALRSSRLPRRRVHTITAVGLAASVVAGGLAIARPSAGAVAAADIWIGILLLATVIIIVRQILALATVTRQSIFAAVSAYLIIGLMFAAFYGAISHLNGGHFFAGHRTGDSRTFQYFSFTTLTTLGYGDFTAAGSDGQAIAVIEALAGQIFLATLVARLVAAFRGPRFPATPGDDAPQPGKPSGPVSRGASAAGQRQGRRGALPQQSLQGPSRQPRWQRGQPRRRGTGRPPND
ncbi:MAG: potassium channel family protein [Streptosporangiaceae bacterium]